MMCVILLSLSFSLTLLPSLAHACTNPTGDEGEIAYNSDHNVMQFCNGTNWVSMAASALLIEAVKELKAANDKQAELNNNQWFHGSPLSLSDSTGPYNGLKDIEIYYRQN